MVAAAAVDVVDVKETKVRTQNPQAPSPCQHQEYRIQREMKTKTRSTTWVGREGGLDWMEGILAGEK